MEHTPPLIMGIININKESFYEKSRVLTASSFIDRMKEMIDNGADIIDIGACSTKPMSTPISKEEECKNLKEPLKELRRVIGNNSKNQFRYSISIDTFRSDVVRMVYDIIGEFTVNDISSGEDDNQMLKTVAELNLPYIAMHKRGTPETMQNLTDYKEGVLQSIIEYFRKFDKKSKELGIEEWVLDPGFGFAKTIEQNYQILNNIELFAPINKKILVGVSRKSMIWKLLNSTPEKILGHTMALNMLAMYKGAYIVRVHDVKEAAECKQMYLKMIEPYKI